MADPNPPHTSTIHHGLPVDNPSFNTLVRARMGLQDPRFIPFQDKVQALAIARELGCPIPTLFWVTDDAFTIPFADLPETFVIKPNHMAMGYAVNIMHRWVD